MKLDCKALVADCRLNLCIQCGTCTGACPVKRRSPLNMRRLVRETHLTSDPLQILKRPELWACTTCSTCTLRCPSGVRNVEMILAMRGVNARNGDVPPTVRDALENTLLHGNPWGRFRDRRADWAKDLGVKTIEETRAETLLYVGCTPSYDPRVQTISKAMVKILQAAEVDFAILGKKESCCGNEIRRMGEAALFKKLVKENAAQFEKSGCKRMIVLSPHCYNTFKNEYPPMGVAIEHYTQALAGLIRAGKLTFVSKGGLRITYQDPCFLGKQNRIFDEPRKILNAIPDMQFVEMSRSGDRSLCCEGGGGRMWAEGGTQGARNGEVRIREALDLGAKAIATACPFCLLTLEDAAKSTGLEGQMAVRDISELVSESMGLV
jgi:Fe-S oxidoreductase